MAVPPCFADLGKSANDLFSKGFNFGDVKLDVSTSSASKTTFKASATSSGGNGTDANRRVAGNLEVKREVFSSGSLDVSLSSKWATNNTVNSVLTANNVGVENLKFTLEGNFAPQSGEHTGKVKTAYKRPYVHFTDEVLVRKSGLTGSLTGVVQKCGFYAGYQATYSQDKATLTDSNFAVGYAAKDFTLHSSCINHGERFRGSLFHSVNAKLDFGVAMDWASGTDGARFGIASRYSCTPGVTLRSKFNSDGELGLSYKQQLNSNVDVTMSAMVDTKALTLPSHRLGLGLDFSA